MFMHTHRLSLICALAAVALGTSCSERAPQANSTDVAKPTPNSALDPTPNSTPPRNASPDATKPSHSDASVRAYIDPATGQLREPTPEDIAAEAAAEAARKKALGTESKPGSEPGSDPMKRREIRLPNGAIAIELDESAQQPLVGCVQKDGAVKMDHDCEVSK
jgi:hypothetical protein